MSKFLTFLRSLETSDNRATLEAISRGYKAYRGSLTGTLRDFSFFSDNKTAKSYARAKGGKIREFELDIKNPASTDDVINVAKDLGVYEDGYGSYYYIDKNIGQFPDDVVDNVRNELKKRGYDGAIIDDDFAMDDPFTEVTSYMPFSKKQIKPTTPATS